MWHGSMKRWASQDSTSQNSGGAMPPYSSSKTRMPIRYPHANLRYRPFTAKGTPTRSEDQIAAESDASLVVAHRIRLDRRRNSLASGVQINL